MNSLQKQIFQQTLDAIWMHNGGSFEPDPISNFAKKFHGGIVIFENGDYFINHIPTHGSLCKTTKVPRHIWKTAEVG